MPLAIYYVCDVVVAQKVPGGVRILWDDSKQAAWGEFIADADWIGAECRETHYEPTSFENSNPFYQRQMTEEVILESL